MKMKIVYWNDSKWVNVERDGIIDYHIETYDSIWGIKRYSITIYLDNGDVTTYMEVSKYE